MYMEVIIFPDRTDDYQQKSYFFPGLVSTKKEFAKEQSKTRMS